ncbi:MAG TPA: DUF4430 domain-containing protein [Solirubrobacterales bacterium]|nr:DUF4430 domain-containing protein [Solirubrobacterales bacterium]
MTGRRGPAVASALLALLVAAGCGLGPGADVGDVELTVTRDYGAAPMLESSVAATESDTVMRVLEGEAEIETRYGGGFVHAIEGVAEEQRDGDPYDWFFFVDGSESPVGAAEVEVEGGERVWWDYRDWSAVYHVPAVVGSWPAPFVDGVGGKRYPVVVECMESRGSLRSDGDRKEPRNCEATREALEGEGVEVSGATSKDSIRVLVGPWRRLRTDPTAKLIEAGPGESGVFADFEATGDGYELEALDEGGEAGERLGPSAGLVAATSRYGGPPVWVVTGGTEQAVREAAEALGAEQLRDHYAVAIEDGEAMPLPLEKP